LTIQTSSFNLQGMLEQAIKQAAAKKVGAPDGIATIVWAGSGGQ
jgi:hypothetical protein